MSATTTRRQRKARPAHRVTRVFLMIDDTFYGVSRIPNGGGEERRIVRLSKADGTHYDVVETANGTRCDCPDYIFRRDGLDPAGCKHVQALRAGGLVESIGIVPPVATRGG